MTTNSRVEELQHQLQRAQREQAGHAARATRYRDILDCLPLAICRLHTDGVLGFANRACCEVLNQSFEDMLGRNFLALCDTAQRSACETAWQALSEARPDVEVGAPAGSSHGIHWTFHGVFADDGALTAIQGIGRPAAPPAAVAAATTSRSATTPDDDVKKSGNGAMVLVVDDEDMVCTLAQKVLEKFGFDVLMAQTGRQALETFRQHHRRIGVVLLDMSLPDIDGKRVFHELRALSPQLPVIVSSGYDSVSHQRFTHSDVSFLPKPYMPDQLIQLVRQLMPD